MNQYLSNYSVVSLYYIEGQRHLFLTAQSLIKNKIFLSDVIQQDFQNTLFYVETEGNGMEFSSPIEYEQSVYFRHKISRKYLCLSIDEEEETDVKYRIALGSEKHSFKITPCYQYQTKISTKIKFNEEIYIKTEYASSRQGTIVFESSELLLGFNHGSKLQFHLHSLYQKQEKNCKHGRIVWLSHIESDNFLSIGSVKNKDEVVFEPIRYEKQIQDLKALWTINSNNLTASNDLKFDEEIRLKNLYNGQFLCFSRNYKLVDNERIYQIFLEEQGSDYSKFMFKPIKEVERKQIDLNSYMSLLHAESGLFLGCRKEKIGDYFKLLTFALMDDEDLFKINSFGPEEEQALRFIFVIRKQFKEISAFIQKSRSNIVLAQINDMFQTYGNVLHELTALKKFEKLFEFVRNELGSSIKFIAENLQYFRALQNSSIISNQKIRSKALKTLELSYQILNIFCENHEKNQMICYQHLKTYMMDVGLNLGAEDLLIETFRNNNQILPLIRIDPEGQEGNLVRLIFTEFTRKNSDKQYSTYWERLLKIIKLLNTFIFDRQNTLDINQYLISEQLFREGFYERIFMPIKVQGERIMMEIAQEGVFELIQNIRDSLANKAVDAVFDLFSNLVNNHSINSKIHIHNYMAEYNQACLTTLINYLNKGLRKELYSALLNFIAKCYIDSAPRLKRQKPMSFIFFYFEEDLTNVEIEEAYYSERLREMFMLKAEESRVCKPLHYSNSISIGNINEPSMTEEQLVSFRLNLTQKILNSSTCSLEQLQAVVLLIRLECYTINEMLQLYDEFKAKLITDEIDKKSIPKLLEFFEQILLLTQELEIKKMKIYLQHKFQEKQNLKESQYKYVLPLSVRAPMSFLLNKPKSAANGVPIHEPEPEITHRSIISCNYLADYNELRDTLELMHASKELKMSLMDHFCGFNSLQANMNQQLSCEYLSSIFNMLVHFHLPKFEFLQLITKCTILTHEEVSQFDRLFDLSKKLQYLVFVSENWLVRDKNADCAHLFLQIMTELISFMFEGNTPRSKWNAQALQIKKQLLIGNLGVHRAVFELLEKSTYLLKTTKKQLKKKHKDVFEICFDFIYWLIKQCSENKHCIYQYISILLLYQQCLELGQTKTFTQFYRDEKDFAKEINFSVIESLIGRIIKKPSEDHKYDDCKYNPDYINVIIVLIEALDIENKFFIEKLHKYIIKPEIFHRLLFLEESKEGKHERFCLKLHRIRIDPIQIPVFYHLRVLKLFRIIFENCSEIVKNSLKLKLSQIFQVEYLLEILAEPDIFSNSGIGPQLNFLLKEEVIHFLLELLEKSQAHSQLYQSDALMNLLEFYSKIFLRKIDRRETTNQSQSLFIPYLEQESDYISTYQNNRTAYYLEHIHPLIAKLLTIFEKQPLRVDKNKLKDYLFSLATALKEEFGGSTVKRATTLGQHGLKDIKLKWRNFVDDDQDNSQEEKYAKKTVLDILKSKPAMKLIDAELKDFYAAISKKSKEFVNSMIKLLTMLFANRDISDGRKKQGKIAEEAMKYFSGYIQYSDQKQSKVIVELLEKQGFIQILLNLTSQKEFELSKIHLKNIFYHCLRILNFLLERDSEFKTHRMLLKRFSERLQANKFLEFLKEGALQVIASVDSQHYYEQINAALQQMRLCADNPPIQLFEESFHTLTLLCKHEPFTNYLRKQQSQFGDIDFLDKIYNILTFLFNSSKQINKSISISSVRAAEYILDFVSSMLTGRNLSNQNYIVDNKYTQFVHQVLKLQKLEAPSRQPAREDLLVKIVEFYHSNGIQIGSLLQSKIKLIDFRELYLLNRFKYILVKALIECLIGNNSSETKIKMELPVEIVKLNFIWIYEIFKKCGAKYKEEYILRQREDWLALIEKIQDQQKRPDANLEKLKSQLFLRLGFYFYQIIQIYQKEGDFESEGEQKVVNEQKEKERVIRKFFATIRDSERLAQNENLLDDQKLGEEMKSYFHIYYNALQFFKQKTSTIEVNLKGQIIRSYFPRLPLAEKITEDMKTNFKQNAVRISRNEKIKSLFEWQANFYEDLKGEDDFFTEIEHKMPLFGSVLRVMQHESEFLIIAWLVSMIICFSYLIENYSQPSFEFSSQFFQYIGISSEKPIHTLMLFLSIINLFIGLVIGFYLFTRKIPLRKRLLELKFVKLQAKGEQTNQLTYVWSNIFIQTIYNFYMVIFLCLTIVHPFFSAFPLIQILRRIEMGRFIIRSLRETWSQLFVTVGLLAVFNILYVQLAYDFFTSALGYGTICQTEYVCLLMFNDQNLKAGQGVFGVVQNDYTNMVLNPQVLYEIFYILISLKVIFEIFSGTIIDKFSELREQEESIEQDQNKVCFICGQERFDLDLQYEGFEVHTEKNHNTLHYIEYLFYLRRCQTREYGIIQRYITDCKQRQSQEWIPELDSLFKQEKSQQEKEEKTLDLKDKLMNFCKEKTSEVKKMHQKVEGMLKEMVKDDRQQKKNNQRLNQ